MAGNRKNILIILSIVTILGIIGVKVSTAIMSNKVSGQDRGAVAKDDLAKSDYVAASTVGSITANGVTDTNIPQNLIYETNSESIKYQVYTSRSIDTLLIAAALYNNFEGDYLMPTSDQVELFKKAKEYFSPYANHTFIKNFGKYMVTNKAGDIDVSLLGVLLTYNDLPDLSPKMDSSEQLPNSLKRKEDLDKFLTQLKSFYNDTHAEDFFNENSSYYNALTSYIKDNEDNASTIKLIKAAMDYTNNKEKYYNNKEITYCTVLSFYRTLGSFFKIPTDNTINLVSVQPAYNSRRGDFNINSITITSLHEYLHNFINIPVNENIGLINSLTRDKDQAKYCSSLYYKFAWNRITDESFVRAIEARLYKNVISEDFAISNIINRETKNGFVYTQALYDKLDEYEKNRETYPTINDFIPQLINELYTK
jgi:hypothetical protein